MIDSQVIGTGSTLCTAVIFFYLSNEGISIVENAAWLGVSVPDKLRDMLAQLASDQNPLSIGLLKMPKIYGAKKTPCAS
ncbi:MAG TPA: phage holin family protein [Anaerovoracaceae bacterium]|nr:phage holin family protein [Anaerovoracaceae bacterium]